MPFGLGARVVAAMSAHSLRVVGAVAVLLSTGVASLSITTNQGLTVTAGAADPATSQTGLYVLVAAIVVQFPILQALGRAGFVAVDIEDFGAKDFLYVIFMTFALWFVGWTVLLTTGTTL